MTSLGQPGYAARARTACVWNAAADIRVLPVTGPANRQQIAEILRQVNTLVATQSPKIDRLTDQVTLFATDADSVVKKVGPVVDYADSTIANVNSTIDQLRDPIRQDLAELQSTMQQAKSLIGSLQVVVQSNDDNGQTASLEPGENPAAEGWQSASVAIRQSGRRHRNVSFRTD